MSYRCQSTTFVVGYLTAYWAYILPAHVFFSRERERGIKENIKNRHFIAFVIFEIDVVSLFIHNVVPEKVYAKVRSWSSLNIFIFRRVIKKCYFDLILSQRKGRL